MIKIKAFLLINYSREIKVNEKITSRLRSSVDALKLLVESTIAFDHNKTQNYKSCQSTAEVNDGSKSDRFDDGPFKKSFNKS